MFGEGGGDVVYGGGGYFGGDGHNKNQCSQL